MNVFIFLCYKNPFSRFYVVVINVYKRVFPQKRVFSHVFATLFLKFVLHVERPGYK